MTDSTTTDSTTTVMPMCRILEWQAQRDPSRVAIVHGDDSITRLELEQASNRMAREYRNLGVDAGDMVAIGLPNSIKFYIATLAALKLGAIPLPLSFRLPAAELDAIVELASPALLVGMTSSHRPVSVPAGFQADPATSADPLPELVGPSWKAMTSGGSTGRPKIIVAHERSEADPLHPSLRMTVDGVQLVPGPLYHQGPFIFSMQGLFSGATIVLMSRFDAEEVLALIERRAVDWVFLVPTMVHRIMRLPADIRDRYDLSSLNVAMSTGAPFPVWLKHAWMEWLGPDRALEAYGGTEKTGGTMITGEEALAHPGSVGRVVSGAGLRVLDDDGADVAVGEVGEIYFRPPGGPGSTYRYIGAESRMIGEWETLGDLGYLDADGYLYLVDRRTDMIVSGGANVYPAEVEAAIESHPSVRSAVVIGLPDDDLGQRVHAIVDVPSSVGGGDDSGGDGGGDDGDGRAADDRVDEHALRAHLSTLLVRYKVPRTFEFVSTPLRDDAGKVRRSALRSERMA